MDTEKMNQMAGRFFKGFALAALVGGAAFSVMVWGCVQIYGMTAQYLMEHECYADE